MNLFFAIFFKGIEALYSVHNRGEDHKRGGKADDSKGHVRGDIVPQKVEKHRGYDYARCSLSVPFCAVNHLGLLKHLKANKKRGKLLEDKDHRGHDHSLESCDKADDNGKLSSLVGNGIKKFSKVGYHIEMTRDKAVNYVGSDREHQQNAGRNVIVLKAVKIDKNGDEQKSEDGKKIGDRKQLISHFLKYFTKKLVHL